MTMMEMLSSLTTSPKPRTLTSTRRYKYHVFDYSRRLEQDVFDYSQRLEQDVVYLYLASKEEMKV